jgi:uncharacterized protein (DUF1015 family)
VAGAYRAPGFSSGAILLPAPGVDLERWAVIACDQFTSNPDYWRATEALVGDAPSALRLTLPEIHLGESEARAQSIRAAMRNYLEGGLLVPAVEDGFVLVDRTTAGGHRIGLVGLIDLDEYDYAPGAKALVRPTEGTIPERVPPRARIRAGALIELPHVMMLVDDLEGALVESLAAEKDRLRPLYDFDLMLGGGHIAGYAVEGESARRAADALNALYKKSGGLLYAVGDGNHSLAAAKSCWSEKKRTLSPWEAETHPARYALVELVNIHSPALAFEPIHRVVKGADGVEVIRAYEDYLAARGIPMRAGGDVQILAGEVERGYGFDAHPLAELQAFLLAFAANAPGVEIDYIHGEDEVRALARNGSVGFLLRGIDKSELFPFIREKGVLPRKAFSMGEARDKRYYLEARSLAI